MNNREDTPLGLTPLAFLDNNLEDQSPDFHPRTFDEYLGQTALKEKLRLYTRAAKLRNEPLDHLLLFGPPGLGKTTLSHIMAHVMETGIKVCSGPMMERTGDLVAILSSLEPRDILFIDEIHRMPANVEEILYGAMEHFKVDVIIGQGAGAKSITLPIHPFTLVGATTKSGMISAPLRSRFGITERLDYYSDEELEQIVLQNTKHLGITLQDDAGLIIARCSRGTPRIAKKLLRRIRDFAQVHHQNVASPEVVHQALVFLGIQEDGLTRVDDMIIKTLIERFAGGPAGVETLASLVGEDPATLEEVHEPFLMRKGYLERTPRGRQIPSGMIAFLKKRYLGQMSI